VRVSLLTCLPVSSPAGPARRTALDTQENPSRAHEVTRRSMAEACGRMALGPKSCRYSN